MNRYKHLSKGLRRTRGEMNATEKAYSIELSRNPSVVRWWFEPMSLQLSHPVTGQPARYTPDFMILLSDGTTIMDDVKAKKGFDDAASGVRIKAAAELYPLWIFRRVWKRPSKSGGGWIVEEV